MKLTGTFIFLGVDTFHSDKKNADFKSACFLQGTDVQKIFLNAQSENLVAGVNAGTPVNVEMDIKTGQNTFVSLVSVRPIDSTEKTKMA